MRVAVAELKQETNTFAPMPTTLEQFQDFHLLRGSEVSGALRGTNTEVGGFLEELHSAGHEAVPALAAFAISGGPVEQSAFSSLLRELVERLEAARPFQGILLALHGAMVAQEDEDADGAILEAVRHRFGPDIPLVVTMDLHACVTRRCVRHADAIVGFRTSPHMDQGETGRRAARILCRWLAGEIRPAMGWAKIPMVTPASNHVHSRPGPFRRLMDAGRAMEDIRALAASVFTVQPWLDVEEMGFATVVVADGDPGEAARLAARLAARCWEERHALLETDLVPPAQAIARALSAPDGPVVLSDLADGTGAGSPGDATAVLEALLKASPARPCLIPLCDPEAAVLAARIGPGGPFHAPVGGRRDRVFNRPVRLAGTVVQAHPASFQFQGGGYTGARMDMGLSAVVRAGEVRVLITSKPVFTVDPGLYRAMDLEPADAQVVVVKSHIQFRAGYQGIAHDAILLDSPGVSSDHLASLPFRRVPRPLFPLDPHMEWRPEECNAEG